MITHSDRIGRQFADDPLPADGRTAAPCAGALLATEEPSLDPLDWEALRALGHRMVDDMLDHLAHVRERPVWQPVPAEVAARFARPAPTTGEGG